MLKQKRSRIKIISNIKIAVVCLLLLLNGCGLVGTIIQLAPLAAIFVYYSAPSEVKNSEFACIKTVEHYKQSSSNQNAIKTRSEYYLCLVNVDEGSVREVVQLPDYSGCDLDKAIVYFTEDKICLVVDELQGTWQAKLDGSSFGKISDAKLIPTEYTRNKPHYAMLPDSEIREINLP